MTAPKSKTSRLTMVFCFRWFALRVTPRPSLKLCYDYRNEKGTLIHKTVITVVVKTQTGLGSKRTILESCGTFDEKTQVAEIEFKLKNWIPHIKVLKGKDKVKNNKLTKVNLFIPYSSLIDLHIFICNITYQVL